MDPLLGLKENVIIGKLIPAGTGMSRYRDINVVAEGEEQGQTEAVSFEEFSFDLPGEDILSDLPEELPDEIAGLLDDEDLTLDEEE